MQVHASALKHGVNSEDALHAAEYPEFIAALDDDSPARELRLGFDRNARLLEVVVLTFDSGNQLVIHAMPARRSYRDLL